MYPRFKKIDIKFPVIDITRITGGPLLEGYGETFRAWSLIDEDYFIEILNSVAEFTIKPDVFSYVEISGEGSHPHSELIQTVLNYYIEPGNAVTFFWDLVDTSVAIDSLSRLTESGEWVESPIKSYDPKYLKYVGSFSANKNDSWLLSTGSIHSVLKSNPNQVRKFFRLGWLNYNVEEVYNSIKIK